MPPHMLESARERAMETARRRRIETVAVQERTLNDRPANSIMFISKGFDALYAVRDWLVRGLLPILSVDFERFLLMG